MDEEMMKQRHAVKVYCSSCNGKYWTSSPLRPYTCMTCRRAAGMLAASHSTALTVAPHQIPSFGKCQGICKRDNQELANGLCSDCRFYGIKDVDPDLSARGKRGKGGEFDWVRKQR